MPSYATYRLCQPGGTGKTTTVVNLAGALQQRGKRVLVVDLHQQGNATTWLRHKEHQHALCDYVINRPDTPPFYETVWEGLDVLPGGKPTRNAYDALQLHAAQGQRHVERLQRLLDRDDGDYDFVLIDCPPAIGFISNAAFQAADSAVLVASTTGMSVEGLVQTFQYLKEKVHGIDGINPDLEIFGILPTRYDQRRSIAQETLSGLQSHPAVGELILDTVIRENTDIEKAWKARAPIGHFDASARGAADYKALAEEVIEKTSSGLRFASEQAIPLQSGDNPGFGATASSEFRRRLRGVARRNGPSQVEAGRPKEVHQDLGDVLAGPGRDGAPAERLLLGAADDEPSRAARHWRRRRGPRNHCQ